MAGKKKPGGGSWGWRTSQKGSRGWRTGWFWDSPAVLHRAEDASCAQTADMQINPRVNAEALSRAYGSDCWLGTNVNMAGATPAYGTTEGGRCFLPQKYTCSTRGFPNSSPFYSSVVSELMRRRRGPLAWLNYLIRVLLLETRRAYCFYY